ncbi:hypothetical protein [Haloarcula pellucida]|uniref:Uncharacterized protein n=1 Tax=Haloarcula pellucida TaxID=1427151 RepID=A0A830GH62_9EURY|nr:hypothetical protein [Halomicroarcula pellucida]MBX0346605.1 hypothetical protein [Halomicroarcula pellucida]GGN84529.1 hypothetical protein GCM10009030_00230 [Halomicroarcula pellucida]
MTPHADCEDCPWSYEGEDLVEVSDEAERHQRKELHDVDVHRGVATDGGIVRWAHSARQLAGVGDQDPTCKHDTVGCPGPEGHWTDRCLDCFAEGGEDGE